MDHLTVKELTLDDVGHSVKRSVYTIVEYDSSGGGQTLHFREVNSWIALFFFFQAEDGIRDVAVTGVPTCALPISFPLHWKLDARLSIPKTFDGQTIDGQLTIRNPFVRSSG